jgi:anti-sigma regulatory factor (Ser/Thr protein kinase)
MVTLHPSRELLVELRPDFGALGRLRDDLRAWLLDANVPPSPREDLLLVATELCTNAIEATPDDEPVEVRVGLEGKRLRLAVANAARPDAGQERPDLVHGSLQERGRGLAIVRALVDTLAMVTMDGQTVVRTMQLL